MCVRGRGEKLRELFPGEEHPPRAHAVQERLSDSDGDLKDWVLGLQRYAGQLGSSCFSLLI